MKNILFLAVLLLAPVASVAQFNPPPVGAYSLDSGLWAPITGTGSVGALGYQPPPAALYCQNGSGQWIAWTAAACGGGGGGAGTVTTVSVVTANGISGTVATATTTPAITLSLNTIQSATTATTQSANDNSTKVATTAYADAVLKSQYKTWQCEPGLGDGLNAITAGTYLQYTCLNNSGATWTITAVKCLTDNNGTSTVNATNGAGTALLTGALTCTTSFASGTQSGTTTIASGDYVKFTFVADGTSKQSTWSISGTF